MYKLLSGLAVAALLAGVADAQPGQGKGNDRRGGEERQAKAQGGSKGGENERRQAAERPGNRGAKDQVRQDRRAERQPDARPERRNERQVERRIERQAERRLERQVERRVEPKAERRMERQAERREDRAVRQTDRRQDRAERVQDRVERRVERQLNRAAGDRPGDLRRLARRERGPIDGCPPGLAKKYNGCMPPGLAKQPGVNRNAVAGAGVLAAALSPDWFGYDDFGSDYRYSDGYLLRTNGESVLSYLPLLGGALAPGQPWLPSFQPTPIPAYWSDYYGLNSADRYRYYDDVIYEIDPGRSEIEEIVALMAGDPWAVGSPMPFGYDVYNVPYTYRARYRDTRDHWYRYSDGYVYDIDPTTRLVVAVAQLLGGSLTPGQPWRASYQPAPIPPYYNDYYGLDEPDRYRYYDDVIYELDPGYSEIDGIVAVTTGDPWAVGRAMPSGYDVYNVPYTHRTRYRDTQDHWYRYSDGYIYDIDPTTRLVLAAVQMLT